MFVPLPVGFINGIERFIFLINGNQMLNGSHSSMSCSKVIKTDFISEHRSLPIMKHFGPNLSNCSLKTLKAKHSLSSMKNKETKQVRE